MKRKALNDEIENLSLIIGSSKFQIDYYGTNDFYEQKLQNAVKLSKELSDYDQLLIASKSERTYNKLCNMYALQKEQDNVVKIGWGIAIFVFIALIVFLVVAFTFFP